MSKVMVYAYTKLNLGDDLFLKILFERYPDTKFILFTPKEYKKLFNFSNVEFYSTSSVFYRAINYFMRKINNKNVLRNLISKSCDASVYIGGSIFQQNENWKSILEERKSMLHKKQPFYVLGANFGPFKSEDYYKEYEKLFLQYTDICFRDTYSFNLFKDLDNVRIADDIVFSLNNEVKNTNDKSMVISVIKPSYRPYLSGYDKPYYQKMKDVAIKFIDKGYSVKFMSFCKHEGDEEAIQEIMKILPGDYLKHVQQYNYRGDLNGALEIISNCSCLIAARFHAMILGWLFQKNVTPIAYSEKMINVMKDVGFKGIYSDFKTINQLNPEEIYKDLEKHTIDISEQIKKSDDHFKVLDKLLMK